jgi:acetyltransferase-like isoleucine patch superfamily enzyme
MFLSKIIAFLKRDNEYNIKSDYTSIQLFFIIYYRFWQVLRGLLLKITFKKSRGLIFCGKNVSIEHSYQIRVGKNLILENGVKINALSENGILLGNNVTVAKDTIIVCTGVISNKGKGLKIGNNSSIGSQSFISCQGGVIIGSDVIMGPGVRMFAENHNFDNLQIPIRKQGENRKGILVEDNCWVGAGVCILDGVHISSGTVIAANSVVNKSFPPNSVLAGIPAKVIKYRFQ